MNLFRYFLSAAVFVHAVASAQAATEHQSEQPFGEVCDGPAPAHSNVAWRCTNRRYASPEELVANLRERWPKGQWKTVNNDPALMNAQGKEVWWDCKPNVEMCGYWVRMAPRQFIFVQQVLDQARGNEWIGVGLTTYCGGPEATCHALSKLAAALVDPTVDFSAGASWVGPAPFAPPLPVPPSESREP